MTSQIFKKKIMERGETDWGEMYSQGLRGK